MRSVGVIRQLRRYPVKSMQGEALLSAALTLQGFDEDRRPAGRSKHPAPKSWRERCMRTTSGVQYGQREIKTEIPGLRTGLAAF